MPTINQHAGNNAVQVGTAKNVNIHKGIGAWGCFALSAVAIVIGIAGMVIVFTYVAGDVVNKNAPLAMTAAAQPTMAPPEQASLVQPQALPDNSECPYQPGGVWLNQANVWYGPIYKGAIAYSIGYDTYYNIFIWDSYAGVTSYPDPGVLQARNQWLVPGEGTNPFIICVDDSGNVYAALIY